MQNKANKASLFKKFLSFIGIAQGLPKSPGVFIPVGSFTGTSADKYKRSTIKL